MVFTVFRQAHYFISQQRRDYRVLRLTIIVFVKLVEISREISHNGGDVRWRASLWSICVFRLYLAPGRGYFLDSIKVFQC